MIRVTQPDLPDIEVFIAYLRTIWSTKWLTNDGEFVQRLTTKLEQYLDVSNLALLNNGTSALHLAIRSLGLKGEVITTPYTFAATTNVLLWEGLTPVFSDIDEQTFNIDPLDVESKITKETSAILAVHVYGNPCEVEALDRVAKEHNICLIYDAAHAFGVKLGGRSVLEHGDVSTLSFHATKTFNTIEGGAVRCKDSQILEQIKLLRNHGIRSEEEVVVPGTNAKMNEIQAVMGLCNLASFKEKWARRKEIYEYYKERLDEYVVFQKLLTSDYNYSYMPILLRNQTERDALHQQMARSGIGTRKYFWPLTADFQYFKNQNTTEKYLRVANDITKRVLCLPLYSELEFDAVDRIIKIVLEVANA